MLNRQYGDPNISRVLQLVVNIVKGKWFVLISLVVNNLGSQVNGLLTYYF